MAYTRPDEPPALAGSFPPATREDWRKLVDGVLKGRPFERLTAKSYDGLGIGPIYERAADAVPVSGRAAGAPWRIMQRIDHPDPATANAQALEDLENGATGLTLVFAGAVGAYGFGLASSGEALARALEGVHLDAGIALELDAPDGDAARAFAALVRTRGLSPDSIDARFGLDPLGAIASGADRVWDATKFSAAVSELAGVGFKGPFAVADARVIHAAGGSEAQELAFALAAGVACLRGLEAGGMGLDDARNAIFFRFAADADEFLTIAKLRALRKLWARIDDACGLTARPIFISAETAWRMMTRRDPHVNMLRATMAAFAAAIGGADAVTVLPFTAALGLPDAFVRRLARNTQLLLAEESSLAKVADPAAGSGAIEDLTAQLCTFAWALFQEIERAGGAAAALASGLIGGKVAAVRAARERAVAHRSDALTGTTEFPNLGEVPPAVLAAAPAAFTSPRERAEVAPHPIPLPAGGEREPAVPALPRIRLAEPFEALRDASDRILTETGARPRVFLATLGSAADFTARATFAKNLFEAGGIAADIGDGFAGEGDMIAAFKASGAALACLCSSDEVYAREAEATARALAAAGARHIFLAGRLGEREAAYRAAGVSHFVYAGGDALSTLRAAHDMLGGAAKAPKAS